MSHPPLERQPSFFFYDESFREILWKRYLNTIHYSDALIGRILDFLTALGIDQSTAVIVTGDHGELFLENNAVTHGGKLHEPVLNVPLIISNTGELRPVRELSEPVEVLSIGPTILSILGLPPFAGFQADSLMAKSPIRRPSEPAHAYAVVQSQVYEDALIRWPWKIVINHRGETPRLFRLDADPNEEHNLFETESDAAKDMLRRIRHIRNSQLTFYLSDAVDRQRYFPPHSSFLFSPQGLGR